MKVEIWSDIMCPFCFIGKRKFEKALNDFPENNFIQIEWKSFQLSPDIQTDKTKSHTQQLADYKHISYQQADAMSRQVTDIAAAAGIAFDFQKAIMANTFLAHRFLHFTKQFGLQNEAKELVFQAFFTDGKNVDDLGVFLEIAQKLGLETEDLSKVLQSDLYVAEVKKDIQEAAQIGVRGVPFFVFDRKYAVSGAQDPATFLNVLKQSFNEWQKANANPIVELANGDTCDVDGNCD